MPAASANASLLPTRTFALQSPGLAAASMSGPMVSGSGGEIAFVAEPPQAGAGAAPSQVYAYNVLTGQYTLISTAPDGTPGNGSSTSPAISTDGSQIAFVSTATNLAPGASASRSDVYVRDLTGKAAARVSVAVGGGAANGSSYSPAISGDGRRVAFGSTASNLVPGGGKSLAGVFVRDLASGRTLPASVGVKGAPADGPSVNPAISANGKVVSFTSSARNLISTPPRAPSDVYVRHLDTGSTVRASVSATGAEQNQAVPAPFHQVSSLSGDGLLVTFDSNATNLVGGQSPQARSDVFVRDLRRRITILASESNSRFQANNDSFNPAITANGRYVTFESFASNLAPGGGPRENVFVRDLALGATSVIDVGPNGAGPGAEQVSELLQRPTISADGQVAVFTSTAKSLTGVAGSAQQAFLRLMAAPRGFVVKAPSAGRSPQVVVGADDPGASMFECQIDSRPPYLCGHGTLRLPRLRLGRHTLRVRAGGPGMLYDGDVLRIPLRVRGG